MQQAKFSLSEAHFDLINQFEALGYADKSSLVRAALDRFGRDLSQQQIQDSADLYAELYAHDEELQELTEQAIPEWPE